VDGPAPRINSDCKGYSDNFDGHSSADVFAEVGEYDRLPRHDAVFVEPYSVLIYSQISASDE